MLRLYIWRHPKPTAIRGLCFGQLDVEVDQRKVKHLANQIDSYVKKNRLPKVIWVSHLKRSKQVGQVLRQRGYQCVVDTQLAESCFGAWEGKLWSQINKVEIDAWCDNFAHYAPPSGESLVHFFGRVADWISKQQGNVVQQAHRPLSHRVATPILVVGHAGWITTATMIAEGKAVPQRAADWPMPAKFGELRVLHYSTPVMD